MRKAVYALRKGVERINADRKNHGFGFVPVRGLIRAKAHAHWDAIAGYAKRPEEVALPPANSVSSKR